MDLSAFPLVQRGLAWPASEANPFQEQGAVFVALQPYFTVDINKADSAPAFSVALPRLG